MKSNLKKLLAIGACAALLPLQALAQSGTYFGGSYTALDYDETSFDSASPGALGIRFGNQFDSVFSAEIRASFGVVDDDVNITGFKADLSVDSILGVYARATAPLEGVFKPYIMVGYNRVEIEVEVIGFSASAAENDVALGVGFDVELTDTLDLNVEYANLFDKDGTEINGLNIGLSTRF